MTNEAQSKITSSHLSRDAYLYVRQSSLRQVVENTESTQRQYALRDRAVALGWPADRVIVIDSDLGQSAASAADREGFQRLVGEVGVGRAGIVLGLEVSRLARNSTDWHRLLEICALTDTLILDEDGIYDPAHFNDRLVLGLKGTMSEAELHLLRARLRGGVLSKARRGELRLGLPVGFVYNTAGHVVIDPDKQVQNSLRLFFDTFQRVGSCFATLRFFRDQKLLFPRRLRAGPNKGELLWAPLTYSTALIVLHNPRYAGAFAYGQRHWRKRPSGGTQAQKVPREKWIALHRDAHEGYITWAQYESNENRIHECAVAFGQDRRNAPPREGPALLQGIALCGICGGMMTLRYHARGGHLQPDYVCQRRKIEHADKLCQSVPGRAIDQKIGEVLLETVSPMAIQVALAVQREMQQRIEETDRLRSQHVERCRYDADLARRRYVQVDPENRLVADTLEADWNEKLRTLKQAEEQYAVARQNDRAASTESERARILGLAKQFKLVWRDPKTLDRDRKRMVRLVIEDATIIKRDNITLHVRFRGGAATTLTLPRPLTYFEQRKTPPELIAEIDDLLNEHSDGDVARILAQRGRRPGAGGKFTTARVAFIRTTYQLKSLEERLRAQGMLTPRELASRLDVSPEALKRWRARGLLRGRPINDKDSYVYYDPGNDPRVRKAAKHAAKVRPVAPGSRGYYVRGAV